MRELRVKIAGDTTLTLCAYLLRMNDIDDCALVLEEFCGHQERLLDLSIHAGLLQALF
jgi:hypothetical protein